VDYVRSGYRAVGHWAANQWSESPEEVEQQLWHLFCTGDRGRVFNSWLATSGRDDFVETAVNVYREHEPSISLAPGALEVLQELGESYKLGLVADGYSSTQRRKIEALNLESMISAIIISDEIGGRSTWKPSPAPFLEACARLNTTPDRAVYIGDNPHKDFLGARAAGLVSVRLRLSAGLHFTCESQDEGAQPDYVVAEYCEVPQAVGFLR
jgi:putative hydrolase of the HAD superfamily